ncbi:sperm tail-domain-containing protein [Polychytrium aggregatum]|uniref:sperm tail-domain-containing protein n=1 Tax=Polychytrium aggregatum TaxID=110093 RepID=UPI0022FE0653|nr:sperm tail-domain-containing protein [Polychytrium aggregatum]KAI9208600.1 sperm tail-domain-containing protein [Polychytrium aggregatum]
MSDNKSDAPGGGGGGAAVATAPASNGGITTAATASLNNTDSNRTARIAQRKQRIEANRLAKLRPEKVDENSVRRKPRVEQDTKEASKSKSQITGSRKIIESTKISGTELVTNLRVGVAAREYVRRQEHMKKADGWEKRKDDEIKTSGDLQKDIDQQWDVVLKIDGPYALHEALNKQRVACDNLISIKNKLINEYISELKTKDDEYVKELKRQAEEISKCDKCFYTLLERMDNQYRNFQSTLREELEQIEKSFVQERTELIEANIKELEGLFEQRGTNESRYLEERSSRIDEQIVQLEELRVHDAEEHNVNKIKLETDIQVLEQQLQQMRGTYQLNIEKLEYNFQVLKKREEENGTILSAQKRKITRLTDHMNTLKAKLAKQEKQFSQDHSALQDDKNRINEQYKELQKKFKHFQISDHKTFKEIWQMNEELAREQMRKVLQADRIIHEQQLGMEWRPPREDLFKSVDPSIFRQGGQRGGGSPSLGDAMGKLFEMGGGGEADLESRRESLSAKLHEYKGNSRTMKKVLELLCNEAGFLVEDKLQKLLAPLHKDEQSLMKLDSIFKALGVETVEDIEKLTRYFISRETIAGEPELDESGSPLPQLIHPNDVISAVKKFVEHYSGAELNGDAATIAEEAADEMANGENPNEESNKPNGTKSRTTLQKEYWEHMSSVMDDRNYRIWTAVCAAMERYNVVLMERWNLARDNDQIARQNEELKSLLRQYMSARVNEELQVPPTQVMMAQAGMLGGNLFASKQDK